MSAARRGTLMFGGVALIVAAGALAVRYLSWPHTLVVAAASVSPIVLIVAGIVALIAFASARAVIPSAVAAVVLAVGVAVQAPLFLSDDDPPDHPLTVLTANIALGAGNAGQLADLVRHERVDILAVQEITPDSAERIARSTIAGDLPHSYVRPAKLAYGTALYSRHPLSAATELTGFGLKALTAAVDVPGRDELQVFAVHPIPPTHVDDWAEELDRIRSVLGSVAPDRPVIALGDFNATVDHPQFRRLLTGGYRDAGEVAGAGAVLTYPTDKSYPPMVGIDHILIRGLTASQVTTHTVDGADHRAVLAKVG